MSFVSRAREYLGWGRPPAGGSVGGGVSLVVCHISHQGSLAGNGERNHPGFCRESQGLPFLPFWRRPSRQTRFSGSRVTKPRFAGDGRLLTPFPTAAEACTQPGRSVAGSGGRLPVSLAMKKPPPSLGRRRQPQGGSLAGPLIGWGAR
jgi:hypothetical protein